MRSLPSLSPSWPLENTLRRAPALFLALSPRRRCSLCRFARVSRTLCDGPTQTPPDADAPAHASLPRLWVHARAHRIPPCPTQAVKDDVGDKSVFEYLALPSDAEREQWDVAAAQRDQMTGR